MIILARNALLNKKVTLDFLSRVYFRFMKFCCLFRLDNA